MISTIICARALVLPEPPGETNGFIHIERPAGIDQHIAQPVFLQEIIVGVLNELGAFTTGPSDYIRAITDLVSQTDIRQCAGIYRRKR